MTRFETMDSLKTEVIPITHDKLCRPTRVSGDKANLEKSHGLKLMLVENLKSPRSGRNNKRTYLPLLYSDVFDSSEYWEQAMRNIYPDEGSENTPVDLIKTQAPVPLRNKPVQANEDTSKPALSTMKEDILLICGEGVIHRHWERRCRLYTKIICATGMAFLLSFVWDYWLHVEGLGWASSNVYRYQTVLVGHLVYFAAWFAHLVWFKFWARIAMSQLKYIENPDDWKRWMKSCKFLFR